MAFYSLKEIGNVTGLTTYRQAVLVYLKIDYSDLDKKTGLLVLVYLLLAVP